MLDLNSTSPPNVALNASSIKLTITFFPFSWSLMFLILRLFLIRTSASTACKLLSRDLSFEDVPFWKYFRNQNSSKPTTAFVLPEGKNRTQEVGFTEVLISKRQLWLRPLLKGHLSPVTARKFEYSLFYNSWRRDHDDVPSTGPVAI